VRGGRGAVAPPGPAYGGGGRTVHRTVRSSKRAGSAVRLLLALPLVGWGCSTGLTGRVWADRVCALGRRSGAPDRAFKGASGALRGVSTGSKCAIFRHRRTATGRSRVLETARSKQAGECRGLPTFGPRWSLQAVAIQIPTQQAPTATAYEMRMSGLDGRDRPTRRAAGGWYAPGWRTFRPS
jgi:hypothetical protein